MLPPGMKQAEPPHLPWRPQGSPSTPWFPSLLPGRHPGSLPSRSALGRCLRVCLCPHLAPARRPQFSVKAGEDAHWVLSWAADGTGAAPGGLPTPPEPGALCKAKGHNNYSPQPWAGSFHLPQLMPVSLPGAGAGSPHHVPGALQQQLARQ